LGMKKLLVSILDGITGIARWNDGVDRFTYTSSIIFLFAFYYSLKFFFISNGLFIPYFVIGLIFMVSALSIIARRLEYLNMSLWYLILAIVPILGIILIIYLIFVDEKNSSTNTKDFRNIRKK